MIRFTEEHQVIILEGEETLKRLRSVNCQLLKTGYKFIEAEYIFCSCDVEQKEPICLECFHKCHIGHTIAKKEVINEICTCGIKCHVTAGEGGAIEEEYDGEKCLFDEWSHFPFRNFSFQNNEKHAICIFCANFCYEKSEISECRLEENESIFKCACNNGYNHRDVKNVYRKINLLDQYYTNRDFNFHQLSKTELCNIIVKSKTSFKNLYSCFTTYLDKLHFLISNPSSYLEEEDLSPTFYFTCANFSRLTSKVHKFYYFNDYFKNQLDLHFITKLLKLDFDKKSNVLWEMKTHLVKIFLQTHLKKDFVRISNVSIRDIDTFNPLQRLLYISNIRDHHENMEKYSSNSKINFLESILNILVVMNSIKVKNYHTYSVIHKLYKICKIYAQCSLFNHDNLLRFCHINDEIIFKFSEAKKKLSDDDAKGKEKLIHFQFKVLFPMIQSLVYLAYYYNDQVIESYINKHKDISKINFFHSNSEIGASISKTTTNILTFVRHHKKLEEKISKHKEMKKLLVFTNNIISMLVQNPDFYSVGMRRVLDKNKEVYLKYLNNHYDSKEKSFFEFLKLQVNSVENGYQQFFECEIDDKLLTNIVSESLNNFFLFSDISKGIVFSPNKLRKEPSHYYDDDNFILQQNDEEENNVNYLVSARDEQQMKVFAHQKTIPLDTDGNPENQGQATDRKPMLHVRYKMLLNKSFYLTSVIKIVKILHDKYTMARLSKHKNLFLIDDTLLDDIIKLIKFYINQDADNCMLLLTSEFVEMSVCFNSHQLLKILDLYQSAIQTLIKAKYEFSQNYNIFYFLNYVLNKISQIKDNRIVKVAKGQYSVNELERNVEHIYSREDIFSMEKLIRIVKHIKDISFINYDHTSTKMRKFLKMFYIKNPVLREYKRSLHSQSSLIIPQKEENKDNNIINENEIVLAESTKYTQNFHGRSNHRHSTVSGVFLGVSRRMLLNIFRRYLNVCNLVFDGDATLNEMPFLTQVITQEEVPQILKHFDLDLTLRTEILRFFRVVYIDIIIDSSKLIDYRSLIINPIIINKSEENIEGGEAFKLYQQLIEVNSLSVNLELESAVLKHELKFFEEIIKANPKEDSNRISAYLEKGIIVPLNVHMNKFMSIIITMKGSDYLKLYELIIYFLNLKRYIVKHPDHFANKVNVVFKTIFKNLNFINSSGKRGSVLKNNFVNEELIDLESDIDQMSHAHFEILNFLTVYKYFDKHINSLIDLPKNKTLIKYFEKKDQYPETKIKALEKKLKKLNLLKSNFEKKVFELNVKYIKDKNKFDESSFIKRLEDDNFHYDRKYRYLILRIIFFLLTEPDFSNRYKKPALYALLKLLQYDTANVQKVIFEIYEDAPELVKLQSLVDTLVTNFLSILFNSANPSSISNKEDYFVSLGIVKILKYLCEEHNRNFQRILFQELKFDYNPHKTQEDDDSVDYSDIRTYRKKQISFFDLMLSILSKIVLIAKWENPSDNSASTDGENKSAFFYDIFFVIIELLIEMIQGTEENNLLSIFKINDEKEEEGKNFITFLMNVKHLVLNDRTISQTVYSVRKDIIDFIMSFLEEKNTPHKLIHIISIVFHPHIVFESIVNIMKKLYFKLNTEKGVRQSDYSDHAFSYSMYKFFSHTYFTDFKFSENPEFQLANRMYQYVKILGSDGHHDDATGLMELSENFDHSVVMKSYNERYHKNKNIKRSVTRSSDFTNGIIFDDSFYENYFVHRFFEKITRSVFVQQEHSLEPTRVIFTLNPLVPFLSKNTMEEFYQNANRENRFSKLTQLMEYSDYFYDEILYNAERINKDKLLKLLNKVNYYWMEVLVFCFTLTMNIIMLSELGHGDDLDGNEKFTPKILGLACGCIALNALCLLSWFYAKFPLYFIIDCKRIALMSKVEPGESLSFYQKYQSLVLTLVTRNEINVFVLCILFCALGIALGPHYHFFYALQMIVVVNLSETLRSITKSLTLRYNQLLATCVFVLVMNYIFSNIAFFYFSEDFIMTIAGHTENECGTLLYCFLTHVDQGLRTDGGIGAHIPNRSYNQDPNYYVGTFFYKLIYFIFVIVILLSIVFGIIIDTFAELREKSRRDDIDKKNVCYICAADKEELEKESKDFGKHITRDHSMWTYAEYIIGLKFMDPQETNAVNSFVIDNITNKSISWFPSYEENAGEDSIFHEKHHH